MSSVYDKVGIQHPVSGEVIKIKRIDILKMFSKIASEESYEETEDFLRAFSIG